MKKLFLLVVSYFVTIHLSNAQIIPASRTFNTRDDLRNQAGDANVIAQLNGLITLNDLNGGIYMWSATSTATDDGFITIKVNNVTTGRWLRLGNSNTIKGSTTFSATVLTSTYTVPFGVTLPFVPITVLVQPRSANAAVPSWVSSITNSNFVVNFASVPVLGTNNITIDWVVIKQ